MKQGFGVAACMLIAGCSSIGPKIVTEFADVDANGVVDSPFTGGDGEVTTTRIEDGSGYSIQLVGSEGERTVGVYVGRVDGSTTGATVRNGTATYEGNWDAVAVRDTFRPAKRTEYADTGTITLSADFDNSKLTGQSTGTVSGETLVIDGDIGSRSVTGTATYAGVEGEIDGRIGADRTYGVFQGRRDEDFVGGGWLATPQTQ